MDCTQDFYEFTRGSVLVDDIRKGISHIVNTPELNGMSVVEDGSVLKYGTKMRSLSFFHGLKSKGYKSVSMGSRNLSISQATVAWCCRQAGLKFFLFRSNWLVLSPPAKEASDLGAKLISVGPKIRQFVPLYTLNKAAIENAAKYPSSYHLDPMFFDENYVRALGEGIKKVAINHNLSPKAVWVVAHSGVTALALSRAFPEAMINIVQTGNNAWPDVIGTIDNLKTWNTEGPNKDWLRPANVTPPFKAISYLDAKVWEIASVEGKEGDLIWIIK